MLYWLVPALGYDRLSLEEITVTMLCFGMGASSQALFARVGGGIFTKAADVGADLVGKVEHGIPEDDPRNPATIADNVGDNVGDVAGMGADLYESYCGSILATAALGVAAFSRHHRSGARRRSTRHGDMPSCERLFLPMAIAGVGIFLSIVGIYLVRTDEDATQKNAAQGAGARHQRFQPCWSSWPPSSSPIWLMPDFMGVGIQRRRGPGRRLADRQVDRILHQRRIHTRPSDLADQALTGPATVIIGGVAEGMISTWVPVIVVCVATLLAFGFATDWRFDDVQYFALGLYGVGIAAVGMLSTLGITLATDAYGPIADNAGGNAQMAGLEPIVRERTDALDSLGNTTAATGKGFAIGSAALTALALLAAYVEEVRIGFDRWGDARDRRRRRARLLQGQQPVPGRRSRTRSVHTPLPDSAERQADAFAAWNDDEYSRLSCKVRSRCPTRCLPKTTVDGEAESGHCREPSPVGCRVKRPRCPTSHATTTRR